MEHVLCLGKEVDFKVRDVGSGVWEVYFRPRHLAFPGWRG